MVEYGIKKYSMLQKLLHKSIQGFITSKKFKKLGADDCLVVFGRVYSTYCLSQLKQEGKIKMGGIQHGRITKSN